MKSAARRKEGRNRHLVAADQRGETAAGHRPDGGHRSPRLQHRATPGQEVFPESGEVRRVGFAPGADHEAIRAACNRAKAVPERVELFDHPHNDVWCRDHGPIFVKHATTGEVALTDWEFNAWGGKFPPWDSKRCAYHANPSAVASQTTRKIRTERR